MHILVVQSLIVHHESGTHVVLCSKGVVVVEACLIQLTAVEAVGLFKSCLCFGVDCVLVDGKLLCCGVVGIQRHGRIITLFDAVVVVEGAAHVGVEALEPWHLPVEVDIDGTNLGIVLDISAQSTQVDERVLAVETCQFAIGILKHLEWRIAVGSVECGVAAVLGLRVGAAIVYRQHETLGQRSVELHRVVESVASYAAIQTL